VRGRAPRDKVGDDLADHRRELEAVAGARRGHDHPVVARHPAEDEIAVGRHGVEADGGGDPRPLGGGQMRGNAEESHARRNRTPGLSRAFCRWICEIASTVNEKPSQRAQSPVFDSQDSHLPAGGGQLDRHTPQPLVRGRQ
jgi:hypothetical protein